MKLIAQVQPVPKGTVTNAETEFPWLFYGITALFVVVVVAILIWGREPRRRK